MLCAILQQLHESCLRAEHVVTPVCSPVGGVLNDAWLLPCRRNEDAVIASIQARIAEWTHLPPENAEPLQVRA